MVLIALCYENIGFITVICCGIGIGEMEIFQLLSSVVYFYYQQAIPNGGNSDSFMKNEESLTAMVKSMAKKHILLLHAGGDSKRIPWANPMGKVFLPLPYLAADDPDGPVPLLFDHILAIASCARQAMKNEGYLCTL